MLKLVDKSHGQGSAVSTENRSSGCACILFKTGSSKKVVIQHSYMCRMIIKAKIHIFIFSHIINYWEGGGCTWTSRAAAACAEQSHAWAFC